MAQRSIAPRQLVHAVTALTLAGLAGCSSIGSVLEPDRVDYKSAGKAPNLEIPPDLTQLQRDNRYALPGANRGVATASGFNVQQSAAAPTAAVAVAPKAADIRVERAGSQRWLVVNQTPEALWPELKDFWQESGFLINLELPESGIMETDWAENRAKIPQDFIRRTIGKAIDSLYSTGERDKFRTRLERGANGSTEIFISHRGVQEELVGQEKEGTVWTPRPADPEMEAEFLARLAARLSTDGERAKAAVMNAAPQPIRSKLVKDADGSRLEVDEGFERAWRRVGLALDRVGFTVEDRDRSQGLYFVRYLDQDADAQNSGNQKGFLSKLFSFGSQKDKIKAAQRYRIVIKGESAVSRIAVQDKEGRPDRSPTADKILGLLNDQLK